MMLKVRLIASSEDEAIAAVKRYEKKHPGLRFSSPRPGGNPKYADDDSWLAYGEDRGDKAPARRKRARKMDAPATRVSAFVRRVDDEETETQPKCTCGQFYHRADCALTQFQKRRLTP